LIETLRKQGRGKQ